MDEIRRILIKARSKRRSVAPRTKARAHAAEDQTSSSEDSALSLNENEEAFPTFRESSTVEWIADTGASAHMTDQLHLFRGPLRRVEKRSVRVGGDIRLRIKGVGSAQVQTEGGVMNLSNVLYVPDLGVNLLSGNALCQKGLQGSFDKRALYMHDKKGSLVLKAVKQGGIYIVNRIAPDLGLSAFPIAVINANPDRVYRTNSVVRQSPELNTGGTSQISPAGV